jgi:hypothetical protein
MGEFLVVSEFVIKIPVPFPGLINVITLIIFQDMENQSLLLMNDD